MHQFQSEQMVERLPRLQHRKRRDAKTDGHVKLTKNAVYGKTMGDVQKQMDFELIEEPKRYEKVVNSPAFKKNNIVNEHLEGVEQLKPKAIFNRPIFVGMSILDISRNHMYGFSMISSKPHLMNVEDLYLLTLTVLFYSLVVMTPLKIFKTVRMIWISATHYLSSQKMYDTTNKGILGKFKSETFEITDFCGLKPKC